MDEILRVRTYTTYMYIQGVGQYVHVAAASMLELGLLGRDMCIEDLLFGGICGIFTSQEARK